MTARRSIMVKALGILVRVLAPFTFLVPFAQAAYPPLPALNVDPAQVSVSGFSSGGNMAIQLGVAYASRIMGVGAFAAIPYDCLRPGGVTQNNCAGLQTPDTTPLEANIRRWSGRENDAIANLERQRVFIFVGTNDVTESATVVAQTAKLYQRFVPDANVRFENSVAARHTFPTDFDSPFSTLPLYECAGAGYGTASPLANCGFDGAGATLQWIYGPLNARTAGLPDGTLTAFDQRAFIPSNKGMDEVGFLYIPKSCAAGARCRLHVFLHPCSQSYNQRGDTLYADYSGHSRWAETNGIVLLFPQTFPDDPLNTGACWDDKGLYDDQFDQKAGGQTTAIMNMVAKITSGYQGSAQAIEYHHAEWDHYFVTANADEIGKLDAGVFAGWARTGGSFAVYPVGTAGAASVCRFFSTSFAPRSSHFYTSSSDECAKVKQNSDWQFEDTVFAVGIPDVNGNCAGGTRPIYRMYNNGQGAAPNHRYTTDLAVRGAMVAAGWTPEGTGDLGVMGCAPN